MPPKRKLTREEILFLKAAQTGDVALALDLLLQQPEILTTAEPGRKKNALHLAAEAGQERMVQFLLDCGLSPYEHAFNGYLPIHLSCLHKRPYVLDVFIQYDRELIHATSQPAQLLPIYCAILTDDDACTLRLLDAGSNTSSEAVFGEEAEQYNARELAIPNNQIHMVDFVEKARERDAFWQQFCQNPAASTLPLPKLLDCHDAWNDLDMVHSHHPIDKNLLLKEPASEEEHALIIRGIECYALESIISFLAKQGNPLTVDDLLTDENTPTDLLTAIIKRHALGTLFSGENWEGQPVEDMKRLWRAIPEHQWQVGNYRQLCINMEDCAAQPQTSALRRLT